MKTELQDRLALAPREERAILDQIRNDHELIERLKITPQELEALSKCALLGTLTCKQDMLFILRQIREATSPTIDHTTIFPQPAPATDRDEGEDYIPDFRQIHRRVEPLTVSDPGALETIVRRRLPEQFGILFWVVVLVAGLVWNALIVMSRWRENFMTSIGTPVSQAPVSDAWYSHLDKFSVLLTLEALFLVSIVGVTFLRYYRDSRRFKVRPGRRLR